MNTIVDHQDSAQLASFPRGQKDRFLAIWTDEATPTIAGATQSIKRRVVPNALKRACQKNGLRLMDAALVYFIREPLHGAVKIGISWDIQQRLMTLQAAHPYELKLLGFCPGGQTLEAHLHEIFAEDRLSGEWFKHSPDLRSAIVQLCSPSSAAKWSDYNAVRRKVMSLSVK